MAVDAAALVFLCGVLALSIAPSCVCAAPRSTSRSLRIANCSASGTGGSCVATNYSCVQDDKPRCPSVPKDSPVSLKCYCGGCCGNGAAGTEGVSPFCAAHRILVKYFPESTFTYTLQVSWQQLSPGDCAGQGLLRGYQVELYEDGSVSPLNCKCLRGGSMMLNFTGLDYTFGFATSEERQFRVNIAPYPSSPHYYNVQSHTVEAPLYCYDPKLVADNSPELLAKHCGYPRYSAPDFTIVTTYLNASTLSPMTEAGSNSTLVQAEISLAQPKPVHCFNCPDPAAYYVSLYSASSSRYNRERIFKVTNATSIILAPLESDERYFISINSYVPCTLSSQSGMNFVQCSEYSRIEGFPKPVVFSPSPPHSTSTVMSVHASTSAGLVTDATSGPSRTILIAVIPACSIVGIFMLALSIGIIAGVIIYRKTKYEKLRVMVCSHHLLTKDTAGCIK